MSTWIERATSSMAICRLLLGVVIELDVAVWIHKLLVERSHISIDPAEVHTGNTRVVSKVKILVL